MNLPGHPPQEIVGAHGFFVFFLLCIFPFFCAVLGGGRGALGGVLARPDGFVQFPRGRGFVLGGGVGGRRCH